MLLIFDYDIHGLVAEDELTFMHTHAVSYQAGSLFPMIKFTRREPASMLPWYYMYYCHNFHTIFW